MLWQTHHHAQLGTTMAALCVHQGPVLRDSTCPPAPTPRAVSPLVPKLHASATDAASHVHSVVFLSVYSAGLSAYL